MNRIVALWQRVRISRMGGWNPFYSPSRHLHHIAHTAFKDLEKEMRGD